MSQTCDGLLEFHGHSGAYIRQRSLGLDRTDDDPYVSPQMIRQWNLREGCFVEAATRRDGRRGNAVVDIRKVNGMSLESWKRVEEFSTRTAIDPHERIVLAKLPSDVSMRVVDLLCPLGKGQRALIVAPPRSGKTVLMQQFAHAISTNHPEIDMMVLLVDERPEEVTDMRRTIRGEVFASSSDKDREAHVRLPRIVLEYAKRKAETGKDVVLLLDSLTKLGRAFNAVQRGSGRTMSGGVDIRALEIPKRIFGAARTLEGGGSLTIVATALVETNSRMDELIFQEFKGTGNMELVLNRDLANDRIFPAINIPQSGTRREELLFGDKTREYQMLRRALNRLRPKEAMLNMLKLLERHPTNRAVLARLEREQVLE